MGKAAELALAHMKDESERTRNLRDRLEQGLLKRVPQSWVNGACAPRVPNTSNMSFPFIEGESMVIALDLKGIACSTGAACSSGAVEPSHVLTALGLAPEDARATLRLSLGHPDQRVRNRFCAGNHSPAVIGEGSASFPPMAFQKACQSRSRSGIFPRA